LPTVYWKPQPAAAGAFYVENNLEMEEEKYPAWLADKVFTSFNWRAATKTSMQGLLQSITLHDSGLYKTFLDKENSWVLIIQLDAIWNKEFCHNLEDWPFLILRFQKVFCSF
jgi:hypothetical protein